MLILRIRQDSFIIFDRGAELSSTSDGKSVPRAVLISERTALSKIADFSLSSSRLSVIAHLFFRAR